MRNKAVINTIPVGDAPWGLAARGLPPPPPAPKIPISDLPEGNIKKIAEYINANGSDAMLNLFAGLSSEATITALEAVNGSRNHGAFFAEQLTLQTASRALSTHLRTENFSVYGNRQANAVPTLLTMAHKPLPCPQEPRPASLNGWILNTAQYAHLEKTTNNPSLGFFSDILLAGLDCLSKERTLWGGAFGYAHIHDHQGNNGGHANSNIYMASAYADLFWHQLYLSSALWGAFAHTNEMRRIQFTGFNAKGYSKQFAWLLSPHVELGYEIPLDRTSIIHFSALDWTISWQRAYHEHSAFPFNEKSPSHTGSLLRSETGLRLLQKTGYNWGNLFLIEKASYVFEKPFGASNIQTGFVGTPNTVAVSYADSFLNLGTAGVDLKAEIGKRYPISIRLGVEGEWGSRYWSSEVTLEVSKQF